MVFVTGDTHIPIDIHKLNTKKFPEQTNLTRADFVIVLGKKTRNIAIGRNGWSKSRLRFSGLTGTMKILTGLTGFQCPNGTAGRCILSARTSYILCVARFSTSTGDPFLSAEVLHRPTKNIGA